MTGAAAMTVSVSLKLQEQLSGGLKAVQKQLEAVSAIADKLKLPGLDAAAGKMDAMRQKTQALGAGMADAANKIGAVQRKTQDLTSGLAQSERQADRTGNAMQRLGARMMEMNLAGGGKGAGGLGAAAGALGGALAGISVLRPIHAYAEQENLLRHMAITQKMSGPDVEVEVSRLERLFNREALATGQSSKGIAEAARFLLTTGMKMETVEKLLPTHAKSATAYNISSDSMGQAVFALHDSFKIPEDQMGGALASMALSAKHGHFTVEAFSRDLPMIGGMMNMLGMTGRENADMTFAALQTVVKNSSLPSVAATNFNDLLHYMVAPIAVRSFAKSGKHADAATMELYGQSKDAGIDLPAMFAKAEKDGVNPLLAFLGKLEQQVKGLTPVAGAEKLGQFLHNQQAGTAAMSLIQHKAEFEELTRRLSHADGKMLDVDFITAMRAPEIQLRITDELFTQIGRRIGKGFVPVLVTLNIGLLGVVHAMNWLDERFPGLLDVLLAFAGWLLVFVAAIAAGGLLITVFGGALAFLATPVGWVVLAIISVVAAISLMITHWDEVSPVFDQLGERLLLVGTAITQFFEMIGSALHIMVEGFKALWNDFALSSVGRLMNLGTIDYAAEPSTRRDRDDSYDVTQRGPLYNFEKGYTRDIPDPVAVMPPSQQKPVEVRISLDPGLRGETTGDELYNYVTIMKHLDRGLTSPVGLP